MFIKTYGLFWRRDEVDWNPGIGNPFRLLGRRGERLPGLWLADFQDQTGIYILYGNHGAYYVGLTKTNLGERLKDHNVNKEQWDRFSWFGFRKVLASMNDYPFHKLGAMADVKIVNMADVITDVEALLIRAMGLSNINQMNFTDAEKWEQVKAHEIDKFIGKFS